MGSSLRILPHYTYAEYEKWEGHWELIEGIAYAMSPLPVPRHQQIASDLLIEFGVQLKKCNKCRVYQPLDYHIADDTILQPDMLVVCGEITKKYLDFPPALVAEVISPATALKDRHTKYSLYESQGIKYYLLVSPDTEEAEIFELENGSYYLSKKGRNIVHDFFFEGCKVVINFKEIW